LTKKVRGAGVAIHAGSVVSNVRGRRRVQQVEVRSYVNNRTSSAAQRIDCDLLACSGGWSPVVHLHCHTGGQPIWDDTRAMYLPPDAEAGRRSAGAVTGNLALESCLQEGTRAGSEAAHAAGFDQPDTLDFS